MRSQQQKIIKYILADKNMNLAQLRKAFKQLSHIVVMKKYLIKQQPPKPTPFIIHLQTQLKNWGMMQPKEKNISQYLKSIDMKQLKNDQRYAKLKKEHDQLLSRYKQDLKKYQQIYLSPLRVLKKSSLFTYFLKQQYEKIRSMNSVLSQDTKSKCPSMGELSKMYRQLSQEQKQQLSLKFQAQRQKQIQLLAEYRKKFQIPDCKKSNALTYYNQFIVSQNQDKEQGKQGSKTIKLFSQLSEVEKNKYQKLAIQKSQQRKTLLKQFLQKHGLTEDELIQIKDICQKYYKSLKESKKSRDTLKLIKQDLETLDESQPIDLDQQTDKVNQNNSQKGINENK